MLSFIAPLLATAAVAVALTTWQPAIHDLPSSFKWNSTDPLISPKNDSRQLVAIKDPSIIHFDGHYHVFVSTSMDPGYNLAYFNFTDFSEANAAPFFYLDQSRIGTGFRGAPQVFYFEPQKLWYLVYQDNNAAYSTNPDISNPAGWTAPNHFWSSRPNIVTANMGSGNWYDMWVICDSYNCYHFSEDDNGHMYRAQTTLADFPNGMSDPVIALSDPNPANLFEASNVYNYGPEKYLLIMECIGTNGNRYFRSWNSTSLNSTWTPLTATEENPFAGTANVVFTGTQWTNSISHGEMVRTGSPPNQMMTISPCNLRYLYQGETGPGKGGYDGLPWQLALLTQTNSPC
ncbi:glycoside hydrolase family 62 protein [Stipitochalara longipes BDJ]|nr:glycoside hydrolase family 62 protein [Stipitochalara longipes BDJ]